MNELNWRETWDEMLGGIKNDRTLCLENKHKGKKQDYFLVSVFTGGKKSCLGGEKKKNE